MSLGINSPTSIQYVEYGVYRIRSYWGEQVDQERCHHESDIFPNLMKHWCGINTIVSCILNLLYIADKLLVISSKKRNTMV